MDPNIATLSRPYILKLKDNDEITWCDVHDATWQIMHPHLYKNWNGLVCDALERNYQVYREPNSEQVTRDVQTIHNNTLSTFNTLLVNNRFEWRSELETLAYLYLVSDTEANRLLREFIKLLQTLPIHESATVPDTSLPSIVQSLQRSGIEKRYEVAEIMAVINRVLDDEPNVIHSTAFRLYHLGGYRHADIAKQLGITEGTSRNSVSNMMKRIRLNLIDQLN